MNIIIITSGALPIPSVKGGAVENLVEMLININEVRCDNKFVIYSVYDKKLENVIRQYKNCTFKYIKTDRVVDKIFKVIRHIINRIPGIYIGNLFISKVIKDMKKMNLDYDAIIVENSPEYGIVLNKNKMKNLILHLHNDYLNPSTKLKNKIINSYKEIYPISNCVKNNIELIERNKLTNVKVLYNGIDLSKFNKENFDVDVVREKFNISKEEFVIMYVGRLVSEKGVKELIQAVLLLPIEYKLKLFIVGSPKYSDNTINKYFSELLKLSDPIKDKVIFTGYIDYSNLPELYSIANIGVVPSLCEDAFNLTTIEFMANKVPVIISDRGGMKEIISNLSGRVVRYNKDFIANLSKEIEYMYNKREFLDEMGKNAYNESKKFSNINYYNRFNNLLNEFKGE
ncbi:glycosyltransferase family 4 protein [Clostridium perfringens]|uniref:glycosyltransferase family 4 protein n=1 Tax=Clostridium perfringens TaxID=1502 RepID=UPI0023419710|nr:glycosyltransferase family 4 protein [Clostridium perfringens]MDC4251499.1 glycosyltransferase family 4 protein [Clostridium perfringens]